MVLRPVLLALILAATGCATTTHVYQGELEARNSDDEERRFLVYWTRTKGPRWWHTATSEVRLLTECSLNVVRYRETPSGIAFRRREQDRGVTHDMPVGGVCGEVLDARRIKDLGAGELELTVRCEPVIDEAAAGPRAYLAARREPYRVTITRRDAAGPDDTPRRPRCREVPVGR